MTGYLAALAALAVGTAPRLRPRALGRFEPEQPETDGGIEAYDVQRESLVPPRPDTPPLPVAPRVEAPAPPAVPVSAPRAVSAAPAADRAQPMAAPADGAAATPPAMATTPPPVLAPPIRQETERRTVEQAPGEQPTRAARPDAPSAPESRPTAPAAAPQPVPPVVPATVVRPAPPAPPARAVPVARAAARATERPTVHVHIGRIEVRLAPGQRAAPAAPAPATPAVPTPAVDPGPAPELEAYLRDPQGGPR